MAKDDPIEPICERAKRQFRQDLIERALIIARCKQLSQELLEREKKK